MIDYKALLTKNKQRLGHQIAAGTHTTSPVCGEHVELKNGKVADHFDSRRFMMGNTDELPDCNGVGRAVRKAVRRG